MTARADSTISCEVDDHQPLLIPTWITLQFRTLNLLFRFMFLTSRLTIFSCIRTVKSLQGIVKLTKLMCGQVLQVQLRFLYSKLNWAKHWVIFFLVMINHGNLITHVHTCLQRDAKPQSKRRGVSTVNKFQVLTELKNIQPGHANYLQQVRKILFIQNGDNTYVAYTIITTIKRKGYKEGTNRIWSNSVYLTSHLSSWSSGCSTDVVGCIMYYHDVEL